MSALPNDLVEYARLREVFMIAEPNDYSPDRLRKYLRRYNELAAMADGVRGIRYDGDQRAQTGDRDPLRNLHIKVSIDLALGWLQSLDQRSAWLIYRHYLCGVMTADLAEECELSQRTLHRVISSAIQEMATFLGWRQPVEPANERQVA